MSVTSSTSPSPAQSQSPKARAPAFCILGTCAERLWGMTPADRFKRAFGLIGLSEEITAAQIEEWRHGLIIVRADAVIDTPLISALANTPGLVLAGSGGNSSERLGIHAPPSTVRQARDILAGSQDIKKSSVFEQHSPEALKLAYWNNLRKRETPYALTVDSDNIDAVAWRMFMGTYKGATDFVTKHIWPYPAFAITRTIAPMRVTPNMVTTLSAVFVVAAYLLFERGMFGAGLLAAWFMALLDTVDGKLARVTLTSSRWGDVFDHGIDLIHPPFWYAAWGFGLAASGHPVTSAILWWTLGVLFAGYVLQRLMEGVAIKFFHLEIHIWRPIDTFFRQITARRNPNMAILTASWVLGRPDLGLLAIAVWTVVCLVLHGFQLFQATREVRKKGVLSSWMAADWPDRHQTADTR